MRSFKSNENIHKKEDGSYYVVSLHPHSLISNFVFRCFDSIIPIVAKPKVSSPSLVSVAEQTGLNLTWSHTTEDRFSRDEAQIKQVLMRALT